MAAPRLHSLDNAGQRAPAPRIGKYDVGAEIGHGGLVKVFRAFDRDLSRPVMLKVLTGLGDPELTRRFRAEVACVARLRTPAVIAIYELAEHVGLPFAAMQLFGEDSFADALRMQTPLTLLQKVMLFAGIAEGLRAVHAAGLAWAGLRPSGIALDGASHAIIRDFGVVRLQPEDEAQAARYAAPEQLAGQCAPDALCDLFACGTIGYELLAGRHPFCRDGAGTVDILHCDAAPLRTLAPECPEELEQIVHRAIEKRRELRYQSVDELLDEAEPMLRELKRERSAALLAGARSLVEDRQWEQAHAVLREILELTPDDREARRLQAEVRVPLQAHTVRSRVEAFLRHAEQEAAAGEFSRAIDLLESALRLDSTDAGVKARLDDARLRLEQRRRLASLIAEARQLLELRALDDARVKAGEALECDPQNAEARTLLESAKEAIVQRERDARIEEGLASAQSLLLLEQYAKASAILKELRTEFPESPEVAHWLDHALKQEAEAERRRLLQSEIEIAGAFIAQQNFHQAIGLLRSLDEDFTGEPRIAELLEEARRAKSRAEAVNQAEAQCQRYRGEEQFEKALMILDAALAAWPGEPTLTRLRQQVSKEWEELKAAAATRQAMKEVDWLLEQDRPDLASRFLRDKSAEFPRTPEIAARLAEVEGLLEEWQKQRAIQEALRQVNALVQLQQWPVALTLVEEALETYPGFPDLVEAAERLRSRLSDEERRRKLARRLDAINQQVSAQAWPQAFRMIEAAEQEFPGEPQLLMLRHSTEQRRHRSEVENLVREVRQCLADGEPGRAGELLREGMEILPPDEALEALRRELEAGTKFREEWRTAQVLFGRRQFQEAESLLARLAQPDRPEIDLLLAKVREARAASEEDHFYKDGREKAQKLIRQGELDQAADLLRNLLALFPGDPILERDLQAVLSAQARPATAPEPPAAPSPAAELPEVAAAAGRPVSPQPRPAPPAPVPPAPPRARPPETPRFTAPPEPVMLSPQDISGGRSRLAVIGASGLLLLATSSAAVWKFSRRPTPVVSASAGKIPAAAAPRTVPIQAAAPSRSDPAAAENVPAVTAVPPARRAERTEPNPILRPFEMPESPTAKTAQAQPVVPPAPGAAAPAAPADRTSGQLSEMLANPNVPTPPPPPAPAPAETAKPAPAEPPPVGGRFVEAQLIEGPRPLMPAFAKLANVRGEVNLEATIGKDGVVRNIKVISGHVTLVGAARNAVMKWRYRPATLNGQPIETKVEVRVDFQ